MIRLPSEDEMYGAVEQSDASYDGIFVVAVRTTKIFCKPSCPARTPFRKNVEFFARASDALHAGYRPCRRCRPMDRVEKAPEWVRNLMKAVDEAPERRLREQDLRELRLDPSRVRRYFKSHYGMTFHAYHRARRMGQALAQVRQGGYVSDLGFDHGYESTSGFRDAFAKIIGEPPVRARELPCLYARWLDTPLGAMLALGNDEGLVLLEFVDRRMLETQLQTLRKRFQSAIVPGHHAVLDQIDAELKEYFDGKLTKFNTPVVLRGTDFQCDVWRELLTIPFGKTRSYGEQAAAIGRPDAQRAVGRANGDNRLAIILPCHRVVRSDGTLCGYGGGLWRKQFLLDLERGESGQMSLGV